MPLPSCCERLVANGNDGDNEMMALLGRVAGPSRSVSQETLGRWQLVPLSAANQKLMFRRKSFKHRSCLCPACAGSLATGTAPGSGARQTARSRCGRLSARPARDCRCPRAEGRPSPGRRRPFDASITRCGRRGGDASEARMCRCAGEQRRAGIGRTADRAKPMRTKVRRAGKGLPMPARQGSPQPGPTTARRGVDHALQQARRRCQQGTHVPMRWRAAPRRGDRWMTRKRRPKPPSVSLSRW